MYTSIMDAINPTREFRKMNNSSPSSSSEIQSFYSGTTIFITGATGFLGKVLVEKLLRTCYDLKRIYILLKPKKGNSCEERFKEYFDNCLFDRLKEERPTSLEKLFMLAGNCERPNLGLNENDIQTIVTEVNCIFHVAATIRFNENLRTAAYINVRSVRDILQFCKRMPNLKSIVHVSTAYSFCVRQTIDEKVYEPAMKAEDLLNIVEAVSEEQLTAMTPVLKKEWPNTYSLTKAIAEDLIQREGAGLPVAIVRPSIVMLTAKEPINGWVDNYSGATGLSTGIVLGFVRAMRYDSNCLSDQVPVDYVVNNMIAVAWSVGSESKVLSNGKIMRDVLIYNYVCGPQNPITWEQCNLYGSKHVKDFPSMHMHWHYFLRSTPNKYVHLFYHYLLHVLPASIVDFLMVITGRRPKLLRAYKKVKEAIDALAYFTTKNWTFTNTNTQALWKRLGEKDKELFHFNMGSLDWNKFYITFLYGTRVYLLKDPITTLPQAKLKALKFKVAHYILLLVLGRMALKPFLFLMRIIRNVFV